PAAGACSLMAGYLLGHVADRRGPRGVVVGAYLSQAAAAAALPFAASFPAVLGALCLMMFAGEAGRASRLTMIARMGGEDRIPLRARLQVLSNIGVAIGAAIGALAAHFDVRSACT